MKIGIYEVIEEVYRSKPVSIYRCRDPKTGDDVAVKLLTLDIFRERSYLDLFQLETSIMAQLNHVPVVPLITTGTHDGLPFLVLQYMPGGHLANRLARGPLSVEDTLTITYRLATALDAVHELDVIHRDVKPENVLFDDDGNAFLSDFGGVKALAASGQSTSGDIMGSVHYMSPESMHAEFSSATDIYGLGITLYEMLTAEKPFKGDTILAVMMAHTKEPLPDMTALRPELPRLVNDVARRATAKAPSSRYKTALALYDDLKAALEDSPDDNEMIMFGDVDIVEPPAKPQKKSGRGSLFGGLLGGGATRDDAPTPSPSRRQSSTTRSLEQAETPPAPAAPSPEAIERVPTTGEDGTETNADRFAEKSKPVDAMEEIDEPTRDGEPEPTEGASEAPDGDDYLPDWLTRQKEKADEPDTKEIPIDFLKDDPTHKGSAPTHPVLFTSYYPSQVEAEKRSHLLVYLHVPQAMLDIQRDVEEAKDKFGGRVPKAKVANHVAQLTENTIVSVTPECDAIEFEPVSIAKRWRAPWVRFDFTFTPDDTLIGQQIDGRISISVSAIEIAHIPFSVTVTEQKLLVSLSTHPDTNPLYQAKLKHQTTKAYQKIFISYSRDDALIAEAYRQVQIAMGNEVFMDTHSLRAGEDWKAALARAIDGADILQLFWSPKAAGSDAVRHEWDYALNHRCSEDNCVNFIRPVYWEMPLHPPPPELGHLNFRYVSLKPMPEER